MADELSRLFDPQGFAEPPNPFEQAITNAPGSLSRFASILGGTPPGAPSFAPPAGGAQIPRALLDMPAEEAFKLLGPDARSEIVSRALGLPSPRVQKQREAIQQALAIARGKQAIEAPERAEKAAERAETRAATKEFREATIEGRKEAEVGRKEQRSFQREIQKQMLRFQMLQRAMQLEKVIEQATLSSPKAAERFRKQQEQLLDAYENTPQAFELEELPTEAPSAQAPAPALQGPRIVGRRTVK